MKLMIIESPGKIEKLTSILGADWKIAASVGHVRDLPQRDIGVEPPDFRPRYELTERGETVVARLKSLVKAADAVYLATDPDREGEAISWHLQQCLGLKNPLRVTFNEITPSAVKSALVSPRAIDVRRVAAQEARRVLDRLVGYMVSPELSRQTGQRLSAGRVQSVAVYLVVERERQIRAFKPTEHFGAALFFAGAKSEWRAEWVTKPGFATDENPYFLDRPFAQAVAAVRDVLVTSSEDKEERRAPPPPFTTSTLQQAASAALGLNPKGTMELAQKLYEQGHITYHRTDNPNVSDESLPDIYAVAVKLGLDMADEPRRFKAKAGAQEGHPAITPTHWDVESAGETDEQRALYRLIRLRAIACQLADARYAVRTARLKAASPVQGKQVEFEAKGRTLTYSGWLKLVDGDPTEEDEGAQEPANPVPELRAGQALSAERGELQQKKTRAPTRYTEASLVKKLEAEGVGRPATYAAIMDNITSRDYVRTMDKKKFLVPTDTGELVVSALEGHFDFLDVGFTRAVEEDLDRIAEGNEQFRFVIQRLHERLQQELATLEVNVAPKHPCPACGKALRRIKGKTGWFWGCSGHPGCSTTLPDAAGKPGKPVELSAFQCPTCGKALIHRVKKGKGGYDFFGCSGFKDGCRESFAARAGKPEFKKAA
jgi:DNA topoisomerase-1